MKQLPMVFGHETAGEVVEIGKNVTGYQIGDRVTTETHIPCHHCYQCQNDRPHICENMQIFGVTVLGAFPEYAVFHKDCIIKLEDSITYEEGAMLEAMGAGVHGVEVAQVKDKTVLVSGCGPIGLMTIGACKAHGAKTVIACDMFDSKLEVAKTMGADYVINSGKENLSNAIKTFTNNIGVDAAIDITGNRKAIVAGLRSLRKAGMLVSVDLPNGEVPIDLTEDIIYREVVYTGVCGRLMFDTWKDCMEILKASGFSLAPAMGNIYKFDAFAEVLQAIKDGAPGKMILVP